MWFVKLTQLFPPVFSSVCCRKSQRREARQDANVTIHTDTVIHCDRDPDPGLQARAPGPTVAVSSAACHTLGLL